VASAKQRDEACYDSVGGNEQSPNKTPVLEGAPDGGLAHLIGWKPMNTAVFRVGSGLKY
jgi:hypothetical protein